jgi:glycogen operon protein
MQDKIQIINEKPYPLGCYIDYDKSLVVRAVFGDCSKCGITLYPAANKKDKEPLSITFPHNLKRGAIFSARIRNIEDIDSFVSYNYFKNDSIFCDPYAKHVIGLETFGKDVPDCEIRAKLDNKSQKSTSESLFDWDGDSSPDISYEKSFVYLLHVRGFTKSSSSQIPVSKRGTFAGILEKIPYIKSLGVTTLELMPAYEMNEVENPIKVTTKGNNDSLVYSKDGSILDKKAITTKLNFWGYKKGYYFAPRTAYCENPADAENEFKNFVKTLHQNGLEVIMQFFFEENENDNLIIDALRYWRCTYHVDGFHLKGARLPIRQIVREPLFTDVKLWNDWFDCGDFYGQNPPNKRYLAFYNDNFLYASRRFLKSDTNTVNDFMKAMISNGTDHGVINYVSNYEGFRLADLVAYEHKHNEENGENNKDGTDNNLTWNCGIEGRTRKHNILQLRSKQIKNILTMLFMAQGIPMIFSGDEFGNSQAGNNNPYCQDNETGWVDWKAMDKNADILEYVRFLSGLRAKYGFLHGNKPLKLMDYISCGYPDLSCHGKDAWRPDLSGYSHILGMLYCGLYEKESKDKPFVYICYNMHWQKAQFALPKLPDGLKWTILSDTGENKEDQSERSVRIYISAADEKYKSRKTGRKKTK